MYHFSKNTHKQISVADVNFILKVYQVFPENYIIIGDVRQFPRNLKSEFILHCIFVPDIMWLIKDRLI